jgi:hypothetical protein
MDLLANINFFDATDPWDKIYHLPGLSSNTADCMDMVSYQPSDNCAVIYRRFAQSLSDKVHILKILQMAWQLPTSRQWGSCVSMSYQAVDPWKTQQLNHAPGPIHFYHHLVSRHRPSEERTSGWWRKAVYQHSLFT